MARPSTLRAIVSVVGSVVLLCGSSLNLVANEQTYTPRSEEEVEVLSLVIASEIKANNWAKSELICFSVDSLDPAAKLVKSLRKRNLNVRSSGEWAKKFNCAFELQLEYTQSDLSQSVIVRSKVVDLRDINKGEGDLAVLLKDGEYSLRRVDGKWSVSNYVTKPLASQDSEKKSLSPECTKPIRVQGSYPKGPFKILPAESYKGPPIIKFEIQENGTVTNAVITRKSDVADIDQKFLDAISRWKYKPRPAGCGVIENEMTVTIDWAASE